MDFNANGLSCKLEIGSPDLEDWRRVKISVKVPNMEAHYDCTMQTLDFRELWARLRDLKNQKVESIEWANLEENMFISLKQDALGKIDGRYEFSSNVISIGPTLSGQFTADQSYIGSWLSQLNGEIEFDS